MNVAEQKLCRVGTRSLIAEALILQAAAGRSEYKTGILEEAFAKQLETLGFQRRVRLRESKTPVH